jgi:RNase P subunit RPR2
MVCGQCGTVLVRGIAPEEWKLVTIDGLPVIVLCSCGGFNEIPAIRPIK